MSVWYKRNVSNDVVIVLKPIEGKNMLSSKGLIDNRLFSGENALHAIQDPQVGLWYLKYDKGIIPEEFKQKFTNFNLLMDFVEEYFKKRNILIDKIID